MIIEYIHLEEGLLKKDINFSNKVNLIFSKRNSVGKTTLLRLILYGLGYDIPNTRKMKFNRCVVQIGLRLDSGQCITLLRENKDWIELKKGSENRVYTLPEQRAEIHGILFHTKSRDLLNNILGIFYVDQEKGWTLLNRGKVIGDNHFNIDELIRGLSEIDCSDLIMQRDRLEDKIRRYMSLLEIAEYHDELRNSQTENESYDENIKIQLATLGAQKRIIQTELQRVDQVLSENQEVNEFISQMKLMVKLQNGEKIALTKNNVIGLNDSIQLLVTRRKFFSNKLAKINEKLMELSRKQDSASIEQKLFHSQNQIEIVERQLSQLSIDSTMIRSKAEQTKKELKQIKEKIANITRMRNKYAERVSQYLIYFAKKLGLDDDNKLTDKYIYTSNLKELSGAMLHKMSFAFKLAYLKVIQEKLKITLPIILDSPRGREVDQENAEVMMKLLKEEFSQNQIIIASIFQYKTFQNNCNIIELKNKLIE